MTDKREDEAPELYRRFRPKTFKEVVGNRAAIEQLAAMGKKKSIPHTLLFTGPSGCGKTTLIRILARMMKCSRGDYEEVNAAKSRGIDKIREIEGRMALSPMGGSCRVWCIDECHALTKDAQSAVLKMIEDTPAHVYFMLATTDPQKLLPTIRTRCSDIRVEALSDKEIVEVVSRVCGQADIDLDLKSETTKRLVRVADGSARKALVLLHQIADVADEQARLAIIEKGDSKQSAFVIAQHLMKGVPWSKMAELLRGFRKTEDPESLRHLILSYCTTCMIGSDRNPSVGNNAERAAYVQQCFTDNFYDSHFNGLVSACWDVINGDD